jgi:hypothetical protein
MLPRGHATMVRMKVPLVVALVILTGCSADPRFHSPEGGFRIHFPTAPKRHAAAGLTATSCTTWPRKTV